MRVEWDRTGERFYESGVRNCVIYKMASNGTYPNGVAWNGITNIDESPSGAESNPFYADDIKYGNMRSAEEYGATIGAYTYPDEFADCDGSAELAPGLRIRQQIRQVFGYTYRTNIGNDVSDEVGYKLHLVYGATVSPSERSHSTINDSPEADNPSWEVTTDPVKLDGYKPTSKLEIDSTKVPEDFLTALKDVLYGTDGTVTYNTFSGESFETGTVYYEKNSTTNTYYVTSDLTPQTGKTYYTKSSSGGTNPRLPLPDEVVAIYEEHNS